MATMPPVMVRSAAATKSTIVAVWGAPESGTEPTSYEVRVDGATPTDVGLVLTHVLTGLDTDTPYLVEIRAISGDGPSPWVGKTMQTVAHLREHFYRPVRNGVGDLMVGATAAVYQPGTTTPPVVPLYSEPSGSAQRGPAWVLYDGVVDFYVDVPMIVDVYIYVEGEINPTVFSHQWVGDILDVDMVNDSVMAGVDLDSNSQFRQQQDARRQAENQEIAVVTEVSANFSDAAHEANTVGKTEGRPGFDATGNRPVWATGSTPTSTWVYADGTTAFTPA